MKLDNKLSKEDFLKLLKKRQTSFTFPNYELVDDMDFPEIELNAGVPAMLIRSISEFADKYSEELIAEDAVLFYASIHRLFHYKNIGQSEVKKVKEENHLSFFGIHQYELLDYFIQHFEN
jgi:hypothetical protein